MNYGSFCFLLLISIYIFCSKDNYIDNCLDFLLLLDRVDSGLLVVTWYDCRNVWHAALKWLSAVTGNWKRNLPFHLHRTFFSWSPNYVLTENLQWKIFSLKLLIGKNSTDKSVSPLPADTYSYIPWLYALVTVSESPCMNLYNLKR